MSDVLCYRCGMPTEEPKLTKIDGENEFICEECSYLCAACDGSGEIGSETCKHCKGTGIAANEEDGDEEYFGW